jgi:hypothetical protein
MEMRAPAAMGRGTREQRRPAEKRHRELHGEGEGHPDHVRSRDGAGQTPSRGWEGFAMAEQWRETVVESRGTASLREMGKTEEQERPSAMEMGRAHGSLMLRPKEAAGGRSAHTVVASRDVYTVKKNRDVREAVRVKK